MKDSRHVEILPGTGSKKCGIGQRTQGTFGVTDMTIRRDLIDLENKVFLVRVHGGAHKKSKIAY